MAHRAFPHKERSEAVFRIRRDGSFRFVSRELALILGFDSRKNLLLAMPKLGSCAEPAQMRALIEELASQSTVRNFLLALKGCNGVSKQLLINLQAVPSVGLMPLVFDGIAEDVTEPFAMRETLHGAAQVWLPPREFTIAAKLIHLPGTTEDRAEKALRWRVGRRGSTRKSLASRSGLGSSKATCCIAEGEDDRNDPPEAG